MSTKAWRDANQEKLRGYRRKHYRNNKQPYIDRAIAQKAKRVEWSRSLKKDKHCLYCEESFWACLEFHHRPDEEKCFDVSYAIAVMGISKTRIYAEIQKCDLICANCHRKITFGGLGLMQTVRLQPGI